jgi:hypothetical protein
MLSDVQVNRIGLDEFLTRIAPITGIKSSFKFKIRVIGAIRVKNIKKAAKHCFQ